MQTETIGEVAKKYYELIYKGYHPYIPTGFSDLDNVIRADKGDSIMVTTMEKQPYHYALRLAIPMLYNLAKNGHSVLIDPISEVSFDILEYLISCECPEIGRISLHRGTSPDALLKDALERISELPISIQFNGDAESMTSEIQANKPDVVFVEGAHVHNRESLIGSMRALAYRAPFLFIYATKNRIYDYHADVILIPEIDTEDDSPVSEARIHVPFNKYGPTSDIDITYHYRRALFLPIDESEERISHEDIKTE